MEQSLNEILGHYQENGWSYDALIERQKRFERRYDKTERKADYKIEPTEKGLQYLTRLRELIAQPTTGLFHQCKHKLIMKKLKKFVGK